MNILLLCLLKSKSAIQTQLNGRTWIAYLHNDVNISVSLFVTSFQGSVIS